MFQKFLRKISLVLRQELHIMPVHKFGKISLMEWKVTCGVLDVSFIRWQLWSLHSLQEIYQDYTKKFVLAYSIEFHFNILMIYNQWLLLFLNLILKRGLIQNNCLQILLYTNTTRELLTHSQRKNLILTLYCKLSSTILVTWKVLKITFLRLTIFRRRKKKVKLLKVAEVSEKYQNQSKKRTRKLRLKNSRKEKNFKKTRINWKSTFKREDKFSKKKEKNN